MNSETPVNPDGEKALPPAADIKTGKNVEVKRVPYHPNIDHEASKTMEKKADGKKACDDCKS